MLTAYTRLRTMLPTSYKGGAMYSDVIIIGGGFAGTAAAITLARANRNIQLIDSGAPAIASVTMPMASLASMAYLPPSCSSGATRR